MNSEHRATATAAWQAYNAMETTKRRHLDYLSALESRENATNTRGRAHMVSSQVK